MRIILDTNVFISGIFFSGPPYTILKAFRDGTVTLVASPEILEEYRRVGEELSSQFPGIDIESFLGLVTVESELVIAPPLPKQICDDPNDDMFIACALSSKCNIIISGDKTLRKVSGYRGIQIISPRMFVDSYL